MSLVDPDSPVHSSVVDDVIVYRGVDLRTWMATMIMAGLIAGDRPAGEMVSFAVSLADELIAELNESAAGKSA